MLIMPKFVGKEQTQYAINPYPTRTGDRRTDGPYLLPSERKAYGFMPGL